MPPFNRRNFIGTTAASVLAGVAGPDAASLSGAETSSSDPAHAVASPAPLRELPGRDARLRVRTIDTPFQPLRFSSRAEWQAFATKLRRQVLSAAGLWPMPERTPLNAEIFDRIEARGFSVEKVFFESYPGFYCTGNLYRPASAAGRRPAILCPHGHWSYGRLEHVMGNGGGPGFQEATSVPQRCMNFALQGYVSFAYDMVGYNDSFQVPHHYGRDERRPWSLTPEGLRLWLWGAHVLGLQLWNSIRALDFLLTLPDVDSDRIACTGASGGGTQTFLLTAVDDRVKVAAPVNMISHIMQGGDLCENAPGLRVDVSNVEIGAMMAPRPLLMVCATGDWTTDTPRVEYPAVRDVYRLFDAGERVHTEQFAFQHNFNQSSREAVYTFFARWLPPGPPHDVERVAERGEFELDPGRMLVFSRRTPPANALSTAAVFDRLVANARRQLAAARPSSAAGLQRYRELFGPVYETAVKIALPAADDLRWWPAAGGPAPSRRSTSEALLLGRISRDDRVPMRVRKSSRGRPRTAVLLVGPAGAAAALSTPPARLLLHDVDWLGAVDVFQTGAALDPGRSPEAPYFPCYNRPDEVERAQDVLTAIAFIRARWNPARLVIVGAQDAGLWCLLARPFFPAGVALAADAAQFASAADDAYLTRLNVPLLRRAGGFDSVAWLSAPTFSAAPLLIHNRGSAFDDAAFNDAARLVGAERAYRGSAAPVTAAEAVRWLLTA
jgi:dienelactone hydrolase